MVYELVLRYLENNPRKEVLGRVVLDNLPTRSKMVSWEMTEESLRLLHRCVNESSTVDDEEWTETRNAFVTAAFKDLSSLRNPHAMRVFNKLRVTCTLNDEELFLWRRKVTKRPDGSAVMVIHVSDVELFEGLLGEHAYGLLDEGLMIYQ